MNQSKSPTIGFISLGCPKALVDSEQIITRVRSEGYHIGQQYKDADLVVVNTCGFIDSAVEESLDAIGEALSENGKVIVTGCLGAKDQVILERHPQVLAITGPHATDEVVQAIHKHLPPDQNPFTSLIPPQGIKLTPEHYAYVKISEGCNHRCTFCIIPSLRGDLVSRPLGEVMQECENLVNSGVKELLIVSQDTSAYGVDLKYRTDFWGGRPVKTKFYDMVKHMGELDAWVRLHYVYPYPHVDEIMPLMAEGKVLPYLDIPFQHASPSVLKAMKRPAHQEHNLKRIEQWRKDCPDLVIRSTFIVGFPGETEDDFQQLLDFIQEARLDRVGCFPYSPVEGAKANTLANPVAEEVKQERLARFMEVQSAISSEKLAERDGQVLQVIVDEILDDTIIGRSYADAPEIDGRVYIANPDYKEFEPGDFVFAEVVGCSDHDLYGQLEEE
ncbi:MAG: 30S ribosomal protein S12 methylthiotransferase RimO [Gammaproteobacteria bacterium]|nr:30S ribosomal protein S12 methylthiotransferase RimO [Gammaproteobacteria bacterium]